jgi:hypothetical protein
MNLIGTRSISTNGIVSNALTTLALIGILANAMVLGLPGDSTISVVSSTAPYGDGNRAKSGPTAVQIEHRSSQAPMNESVTNDDAFVTERPGFEPGIRV